MRQIELYDTTLRDGAQTEAVSFSLQDKLLLTQRLDDLGFDFIEGGYPASNEKDSLYFQKVKELDLAHIRVCAFGMTRRKGINPADDEGLNALLSADTPVITLVGKSSAFQVTEVLATTLEENLAMIDDSIRYLREQGRDVIFDAEHFFDGYKYDTDYTLSAVRTAANAGARMVVFCDTNGGTMPEEVARITHHIAQELDCAVGIHCHNDCELAVANSLTAIDAGAAQVQGTINGFGERCGNADLISVAANLAFKKQGYQVLKPDALSHLTELSRYVYELVNMHYRDNQPFVGKSAFAHKGGMHVSGIARNTASYEHLEPEKVGNERRILISELSGRSNILAKAKKKLNGSGDRKREKRVTEQVLASVVALENKGYQFEAAEGSFDILVRKCLGQFSPHFERIHYRVNILNTEGEQPPATEATVKLKVGEAVFHQCAEGDGPVNALDGAMRRALNSSFPNLANMHLVDYKVRVINSDAGTAAFVRVVIESQDENETWGTVGVSENIIEASWAALVDSFEYKLYKDKDKASEHAADGPKNTTTTAAIAAPPSSSRVA